ncbi:MAG: CvpA family protein [Helicobacter sp.]|nr:CvpA family protein [Helicobacter sp.]
MLSYIDIGVLSIVLIVGLRGLYGGLLREIFTFFGVLVGVFVASFYSQELILFFSQNVYAFKSATLTQFVAFVAILFVIYIIFLLLGIGASRLSKFAGLGLLDRILGYIFACLKTFAILSFLLYGLMQIKFVSQIDYFKQLPQTSVLFSSMNAIAKFLIRFDDFEAFQKHLKERANKIKQGEQYLKDGNV